MKLCILSMTIQCFFGCSLFSASISPSLLKNFLVHLLIPPAIVNTRGVKDACSTCTTTTTNTTTTVGVIGIVENISTVGRNLSATPRILHRHCKSLA